MSDIFGFGIIRPFQRDNKNDFASAGGIAQIRSALSQIIGTRGSSPYSQGELPWRTEFGSLVDFLKHENTALIEPLANIYIAQVIKTWEPRVEFLGVEKLQSSQGTVILNVRVRLKTTGEILELERAI